MSFTSPSFAWAFLCLIPLAAIYLLKIRPVRKPTTAWFLWEDIFQENKATSLFQRFRDLFSLLLMAAAFSVIVLAMMRPNFTTDTQQDLILLIDNSASMNALDSSETRLEQAITVATDIATALNGNQRGSVATVSDRADFQSNLTDNPKELLSAIQRIEPTTLASRENLLQQFRSQNGIHSSETKQAQSNTKPPVDIKQGAAKQATRIVLISDGNFTGDLPDGIELLKVGQSESGNIGLVACDMQRLPGRTGRVGFFFQVASTFDKTVEAELTLGFGTPDQLSKFVPLEVKPGLNPPEVFELEDAQAGKWFVKLKMYPQDSFTDDDYAFLFLPPKRPIPIAVVAENPYFYENCIQAFSRDQGILSLTNSTDEADKPQLLLGTENFSPPLSFTGDLVIFKPTGKSPFWQQLGSEIEVVEARIVDDGHPIIRHIDPTVIPYVGARKLQVPPGAQVLVKASDGTPLIYLTTHSGRSAVVLNFDPLASDFFFSAWFPVIVYSSATHLAGRVEKPLATWRTGQYAAIAGVKAGETTQVTTPTGKIIETQQKNFGPLKETGFYELSNSSGRSLASCSLLSANETLHNNSDKFDTSQPINRGWSPTTWLTLLAIATLVAEAILYQRRKVG